MGDSGQSSLLALSYRKSTLAQLHGFPPAHWRTTTLDAIRRPGFCATILRKVKHRLHSRFRLDLRRQISEATRKWESLREQGKLKKVIASILQKDTELYALHSLQVEQGLLTDAPTIHNLVTEHFTEWYRAPLLPRTGLPSFRIVQRSRI